MADFKTDVPPKGVPRRRRTWRAIILTICALICGTVFISCCALAVLVASVLSGIGAGIEGIFAPLNTLLRVWAGAILFGAGALILFFACLLEALPIFLYLVLLLCFAHFLEIAISWLQMLGLL